jgi:Iap family predicted aminopeptidase
VRPLLAALACVALLMGCDSGGDDLDRPSPAPVRIDAREVSAHLRALQRIADENGGNRAAGTGGYAGSARYVADVLRAAGWSVREERFRFPWWEERSSSLRVEPGPPLVHGRDFRPVIYSGAGSADGALRDVGNGCTAAELAAVAPGELALASSRGCLFRVKATAAEGAGAAALLIADPARRVGTTTATLTQPGARLPVVMVRRGVADGLRDGMRVRLSVRTRSGERTEVNVVGETEGSGRGVVMAGAHLDSVAAGPGLNDNGSGVAALLAGARRIGPRAPGPPVRVAFFGAEELGLYGSRAYVRGLGPDGRHDVRAYLNLDMVGSPNPVVAVYGSGESEPRARRAARRIADLLRGLVRPKEGTGGASDHVPFARAGVPVGGVFTGATERGPGGRPRDPCYHLACDRLANVNVPVLVRMARAAADALATLSRQAK